jgi:hypothetical protein
LAIAVVDDVLKQAGDLSAKAPSEVLFDVFRRKRRTPDLAIRRGPASTGFETDISNQPRRDVLRRT